MNKSKFKKILLCITYAILLYFLMLNFNTVIGVLGGFAGIVMPFVYGFAIAYLLNYPYRFFLNRVFAFVGRKKEKTALRRTLSLVCSYVIFAGLIALLIGIIIPAAVDSITNLVNSFSQYVEQFENFEKSLISWVNATFGTTLNSNTVIDIIIEEVSNLFTSQEFSSILSNIGTSVFPVAISAATDFTVTLYNWVIGLIISVYYLACKDKLCHQTRKLTNAFVPSKYVPAVFSVTRLSNDMCGRFLFGKIIDSLIIGVICFICMSLFGFEYAVLISFIVGITNIIPFFGPFIGAIPSAFLLLLVNPVHCFWFVVFIIVLQQVDGNIIGPKILGNSVGVSGFWIMASVIIGGGLFGVPGMVLGVPVFAVIYTLLGRLTNLRIHNKIVKKELTGEYITPPENETVAQKNIKKASKGKSGLVSGLRKKGKSKHENDDNQAK